MALSGLRVGIIGAGLIAPAHAAGFQECAERVRVTAVCDVDAEKAATLAALFDARVLSSYHDLLAEPDIDLVDILLPHHLHYPAAMEALGAGKHVLLEKPVAVTYAQSMTLVEEARRCGRRLLIAENTPFVRAYQAVERILHEGRLGEVSLVRTFLPANERFRLGSPDFWGKKAAFGGGALIDSGPHTFYLIKWLFGEVRELWASTSQLYAFGSEVEDNAVVAGRLASGAEFHCGFSFSAECPHSERLEIYGSKGALIVDQLANPPVTFFAGPMDYEGQPVAGVEYDPMGWHFNSIVEEVKDCVASLLEDRPTIVDVLDCCYAVKVIEKAYESAHNDRKRVKVD